MNKTVIVASFPYQLCLHNLTIMWPSWDTHTHSWARNDRHGILHLNRRKPLQVAPTLWNGPDSFNGHTGKSPAPFLLAHEGASSRIAVLISYPLFTIYHVVSPVISYISIKSVGFHVYEADTIFNLTLVLLILCCCYFNFLSRYKIYNVVLVSGVQHYIFVVVAVSLFQILFYYRLLQDTENSSLCHMTGLCCLSVLYIALCIC